MKILQLISSLGYFGAENVLVQLAGELQKDHTCQVITGVIKNLATPHVEVAVESQKKGIESVIFPCRGKLDLRTLYQIRQVCRKNGVTIIHSHGYKANLYAFFATVGLPIALVATCHNWLGDEPKMKFFATLDRLFLKNFSHIAAVSGELKQKIIDGNISCNKISVIKNGIDIERFRATPRPGTIKASLGIPEGKLIIGTVGRISAEKGHIHLLNGVDAIGKIFPEFLFLIVGDGELEETLRKKYIAKNILFTGFRSDLPELYACMDIFALPSLTEGLPMVLLEAMASGLPVVATSVGDVPKLVKNDTTGFLVAPGDENALQERLLFLLNNPQKRKAMGEKAYHTVKTGYSSEAMAREYLSVYRHVISGLN